jgi:anti-sigma regulatory factor (Ser/Thr protein kinase)
VSPGPGGISAAAWTFAPEILSVPRARRAVRAQLADWELHHACEFAELLAGELVANAVQHARGRVRVSLSSEGGRLRCEVEDSSRRLPRRRPAAAEDEGSRGLHLVEALSSGWGSVPTRRGKVVWFELAVAAAVAPADA